MRESCLLVICIFIIFINLHAQDNGLHHNEIKISSGVMPDDIFYITNSKINSKDITFVKSLFIETKNPTTISTGSATKNPLHLVFSSMFIFYKKCISSQDGQSCNFSPSCSAYALKAIKKKGIIIGFLATFDRLARCNSPFADGYQIDIHSHKLIDDL